MVMTSNSEVLISNDGETFEAWNRGVPSLENADGVPFVGGAHCQVAIDDDLIFIAGGWVGAEVKSGIVPMKSYQIDMVLSIFQFCNSIYLGPTNWI